MIKTTFDKVRYSDFFRIFNFKDEFAKGRSFILLNTFIASIANVFISGVFYTGFLTINGIDIVRVGIIAFIPYIAWGFSLFSPVILSKIIKRRFILIFNSIFYYSMVVIGTTVMPIFVHDATQKTIWFGVFLLLGNISNALFGSAASSWHIHFLPKGDDRNIYFSYSNLVSAIVSTFVAITASLLADSLAGSPRQAEIITMSRYLAAAMLVFSTLLLYLIPKEYAYTGIGNKVSVIDIIRIPLRSRKFLLTALIVMIWSCFANINASTWTYYVLNTVQVSYTFIYIGSVVNAVCSAFLLRYWRKAISFYSWSTMLLFTVLVTALTEFPIGFATSQTKWVYVVVSIIQGFNSVGTSLVFANLFYVNLPKGNVDIYIIFWNFTANISVLIGSAFGTWFLSIVEPYAPWYFLGLPFYGSQFLVIIKGVLLLGLCLYIRYVAPMIQPDPVETP
ncbi:MAG: MFS transporter [Ruminococcaceae bacterium]|nr:MFS transporter [Oscillospiraceae bacterium]